MASTGEVGCLGDDFEEAFLKALLSVGYQLPIRRTLLSTGPIEDKASFLESERILEKLGVGLFTTRGTTNFLSAHDVRPSCAGLLKEKVPNTLEFISQRRIDLVINIPKNFQEDQLTNDYVLRRKSVDFGIPLITNIQLAQRFVEALERKQGSLGSLEMLEPLSKADRLNFPSLMSPRFSPSFLIIVAGQTQRR
jgi:carbamoyl-phosphate synthase large subunit